MSIIRDLPCGKQRKLDEATAKALDYAHFDQCMAAVKSASIQPDRCVFCGATSNKADSPCTCCGGNAEHHANGAVTIHAFPSGMPLSERKHSLDVLRGQGIALATVDNRILRQSLPHPDGLHWHRKLVNYYTELENWYGNKSNRYYGFCVHDYWNTNHRDRFSGLTLAEQLKRARHVDLLSNEDEICLYRCFMADDMWAIDCAATIQWNDVFDIFVNDWEDEKVMHVFIDTLRRLIPYVRDEGYDVDDAVNDVLMCHLLAFDPDVCEMAGKPLEKSLTSFFKKVAQT